MGDLYNKANAPYLIAGALATLVLLASGTLAVAPYVKFLSSVAAFNVALPVALSLSILSILVLALSCKMISKNKKLDEKEAELNEKNGLAKEQENTIQSLEPQIKELNKRLSSQYNEIVKLIGSAAKKEELNKLSNEVEKLIGSAAKKDEVKELVTKIASAATKEELKAGLNGTATKDEVKQLRGELGSLTEKYNQIANLGEKLDSAATKDEVEELSKKLSSFTTKLDEISKQANDATTKGEMEELSKKFSSFTTKLDEISKQANDATTKDEVEQLRGEFANAGTKEELKAGLNGTATKEELEERLGSLIKKVEVKEELRMKFYEKDEERGNITFDDVILPNDIKQKLVRIYQPNALEKGEGYILYGPPGTGKTMTAKAIASETRFKSAFISVSGSDLLNVSNINKVFEKAKENVPCIVFIDEIDSIGKTRSDNNVESLNNLLAELDGFQSRKGVTVIAATNHISDLDKALTRGGRLSNHINIPPLDTDTRKKIIDEYLKETKPHLLKRVLDETKGFSPANLLVLLHGVKEKKFTSTSKVGEFCQHFKKTHGIDNVSNKQRTNEKTLNTLEKTPVQETASSLEMIKDLSSEHSSELGKIDKDKFVNELPSSSHMSTPKTKNSTQHRTKSPRKSPEKEDEDENKENSGPQNQKSPNASLGSPHLSPFKDTTNNSYYTLTM